MQLNNILTEKHIVLAKYAKVLSNPIRIFILNELLNTGSCFKQSSDIRNKLNIAKSTFCQHLKELKKSDLILEQMDFPRIKYCINRAKMKELKALFGDLLR
jgi:predicted transcriptional regulator